MVDPVAKTVEITFKDENPTLARDLAQAMAETFIAYDVERQGESAESVINFIRSQKDTVFNQLRESEFMLQEFRMDNQVADLEQMTPIFLERSEKYEDELIQLTMEIELLKAMAEATDKPMPEINSYDLLPMLTGTEYEKILSQDHQHPAGPSARPGTDVHGGHGQEPQCAFLGAPDRGAEESGPGEYAESLGTCAEQTRCELDAHPSRVRGPLPCPA